VAGLASSQADTVYSQNVVGYINITVAPGAFTLMGNQLVNGNNNIQTVLSSGLVSDPNGINNTTMFWWNGANYNIYAYYTDTDAQNQFDPTFGDGWYASDGTFANVSLGQGTGGGHFLRNASASPITVTLVGQVLQGTNSYTVKPGFNTYNIPEPVSTNLDSTLVNFPGTSDPNGILNDVYYHYNGANYDILTYYTDVDAQNQFDPTYGDGWYAADGSFGSADPALYPKVGEGFFIYHAADTTNTWVNVFNVQ
jgi:hypothetical protein